MLICMTSSEITLVRIWNPKTKKMKMMIIAQDKIEM